MKSKKIMPDVLEDVKKHTHDPIIQDAFRLKAYENYSRDLCDQFAANPSLTEIGCMDRVEVRDCLDFYTRQFASIMDYLLKTDRQLKEYMNILEKMNLTDD